MTKQVTICDIGWELYDVWVALCDKKENVKKKNKALDREVAGAKKVFKDHTLRCTECEHVDI
jgi:hypothetical protein